MSFPSNPTLDQIYFGTNGFYQWNGKSWIMIGNPAFANVNANGTTISANVANDTIRLTSNTIAITPNIISKTINIEVGNVIVEVSNLENYMSGVNATQNTEIATLNTELNSNVSYISGVDNTQNTNITYSINLAQNAYNKANSTLSLTGGTITGNVTIDGYLQFSDGSQISSLTSLGLRNRLINGGIVYDQYNLGNLITPSTSQYVVDRWLLEISQGSKLSTQRIIDPTPETKFAQKINVASSYVSTSTDYFVYEQRIEGLNLLDLGVGTANAEIITLSFYAKSNLTGTFSIALHVPTSGTPYSYVSTYNITQANTWQKFSITISPPIYGNNVIDSTTGMYVYFDLGCGSNRITSTTNQWITGDFITASGSISLVSNANAYLELTGIQLEKGSSGTPFEYVNTALELSLCQRYFYQINSFTSPYAPFGLGNSQASNYIDILVSYPVPMRAPPTVTSAGSFADDTSHATGISNTWAVIDSNGYFPSQSILRATVSSVTSGTNVFIISNNNNATYMNFSAEL